MITKKMEDVYKIKEYDRQILQAVSNRLFKIIILIGFRWTIEKVGRHGSMIFFRVKNAMAANDFYDCELIS